jgi:hypothetical protein
MVGSSEESHVKVTSDPGHNGGSSTSASATDSPSDVDAVTPQCEMPANEVATGFAPRGFVAVVMGLAASTPLAWLLSHAVLLPFFLGLFFYALFGLVIGAIMHRVAAPRRPYSKLPVLVGTTLVVLFGWSLSILQEAEDSPAKLAEIVSRRTRNIGDRTVKEFRSDVAGQIRDFIAQEYPPGGALGFVRWAASGGEIARGSIQDSRIPLELPHQGILWLIRVVLAVGLLAFGVGSQTFLLRLEHDPAVRRKDES